MFFILSLFIFFVSLFNLFLYKREPYSLHKTVNLFFLFFYSVAPVIQYKNNIRMWGGNVSFTISDFENTSFILLGILLLFNVLYYICKSYLYRKKVKSIFVDNEFIETKTLKRGFLVSLLIFLLYLYINEFNILSLLFRGGEFSTHVKVDSTINSLIGTFIRPIPIIFIAMVGVVGINKSKSINFLLCYILFLVAILVVAPTGLARFAVAAYYLPLLLVHFNKLMTRSYVFILIMVIGVLVIFPFFNNFRLFSSDTVLRIGFDFKMFEEGHFDAYSIFLRVLKFDIVTYGYQLLGPLLFFIPRSVWPEKPVGSGYTIAHYYNLDFDNISCPYFAEGYMNFGYLGVFFFIIILSFFTAKMDNWYWRKLHNTNSVVRVQYYLLIGLLFFIMRGDLLSTTSFTVGILFSFYFVKWLIKRN